MFKLDYIEIYVIIQSSKEKCDANMHQKTKEANYGIKQSFYD